MSDAPTISRKGDRVIVDIHVDEARELNVALAPCPCRAVKSTATTRIRARLSKGLSRILSKP